MIPRVLELKNFLSYGDSLQTVDFKNHDLICLSGKNGNGKSALLDALTWALWGQARKISGATKADEGLLRLGQTQMMVCAEFEFNQQIYRVRREFAKTYGKPYSALDFEIFDHSRQAYSSLTDKTVRATQEKIELLLGLDYDTFINTSFLRQGQANEFSKKNPKERKQILAAILGLSKYDVLQQQAQEAMRHHADEKKLLTTLQEQSLKDLDQETILAEQLKTTQSAHEQSLLLQQEIQKKMLLLEQEKASIAHLKNQNKTHQQEYLLLKQKQQEKIAYLQNLVTSWKTVHKATLLLPNLKELEARKRTLLDQEKHFLELRQKKLTLQEQQLHLKEKLNQRQALLHTELEKNGYLQQLELEKLTLTINQQLNALAQKQSLLQELAKKHTTLSAELTELKKQLTTHAANEQLYSATKKQFEKRRTAYQTFIQKGNWLKNALQESDQKKKLVDDLDNPACPLCEQMLTAKRKQFLGAKLVGQEHFLRHQITRISAVIRRLKDLLLEQHKNLELLEKGQDLQRQQAEQERMLSSTLAEVTPACEKLVSEVAELQQRIDQDQLSLKNYTQKLEQTKKTGLTIIASDTEIKQLTEQLVSIDREKSTHVYDQTAYTNLQETIKNLDVTINNIHHLAHEQAQQPVKRSQIAHSINDLKEIKKNISTLELTLQNIATTVKQEESLIQALNELKKEAEQCTVQNEQIVHQKARLEAELQRIEKIKAEQTQRTESIALLQQVIDDYQLLAQAFSKNGIQALLIEEAIPEIEQEANALLSKLTDNQAQIFIESLRDLKSGGAKESLDIHISDAAGIRPYEMYSGGEAFRVDFALRIAISKLLARRAGTALQTLIIDEGFGSQDEEGLNRITEALYTIKNDFSKIIIVSHLPEMKDNFPVHFIVEKQPSGSIIRIEERG